jgi:hypothetical protein
MRFLNKHPDAGALLAYRDGELPSGEQERIGAHVADCDPCRARMDALVGQAGEVGGLMAALRPTTLDAPDARRALATIKRKSEQRSEVTMLERIRTSKRAQRTVAAIAALVLVVGLFTLAPVRALAAQFLDLFRVERFVTVEVSPERVEQLNALMDENTSFGEVEGGGGEPVEVASLDEAAAVAGFTPRVPQGYGDPAQIEVSPASTATFTPDVEAMRQVFVALDLDPMLLPDNIDGQEFVFNIPAGIALTYEYEYYDSEGFSVMQAPSPTVEGPDDVDMQQLGNAMLQLLGMSPEEAERLSASIDWTTTMVLPIPTDVASVREVEVDGATGLAFELRGGGADPDESGGAALLWQNGGYVYMLGADQSHDSHLLEIAATMR